MDQSESGIATGTTISYPMFAYVVWSFARDTLITENYHELKKIRPTKDHAVTYANHYCIVLVMADSLTATRIA